MRRLLSRRSGLVLLVAAGALVLVTTAAARAHHKNAQKKPVVIALSTPIDVLDPQLFKNDTAYLVQILLYGSLLQQKYVNHNGLLVGTNQYESALAKSWSFSNHHRVITFHLQKGLKWPDGSPLTAKDWAYTWRRIFKGPGYIKLLLPTIGIEKPSDVSAPHRYTLRIKLAFLSPELLPFMASPCCFNVMSAAAANKHRTKADPWAAKYFTNHAVESGPYILKSESSQQITLVPNPNYPNHRLLGNSGITFKIIPSAQDRQTLVQGGAVNEAQDLAYKDYATLSHNSNVKVWKYPGRRLFYVGFNLKSPPFDNLYLRAAIQKAIPYQTLVKDVLYGYGKSVGSVVSRGMAGYTTVLPPKQDLAAAKALLAKSSYSGQTLTLSVRQSQPNDQAAAVYIQSALKQIGVNVQINIVPDVQFQTELGKKELPFFIMDWQSLGNDCFYQLTWTTLSTSPVNYTNYANAKVDQLINAGTKTSNVHRRNADCEKAQKIWAKKVPWAPLYQPDNVVITPKGMSGVTDFYDPEQMYMFLHKK